MRGEGGWSDQSKKSKNFCSACAGFGVFSFCAKEAGKFRREAGKLPLHESTDSSQGWTVLRMRKLQKRASGLAEGASGHVRPGTSCAAASTVRISRLSRPLCYGHLLTNLFQSTGTSHGDSLRLLGGTHRSQPASVCHLTQDRTLGNSILQVHGSQLTA